MKTPVHDCDYVDAKTDKRHKGCRERAQFQLYIVVPDAKSAVEPFAGAVFYACRGHAKDVFDLVGATVEEMKSKGNPCKFRVVDMDKYPEVATETDTLAEVMKQETAKRRAEAPDAIPENLIQLFKKSQN